MTELSTAPAVRLPTIAELQSQLVEASWQRDLLAQGIRDAVVKVGMIRADADLTVPHLLQFVNELADDCVRQDLPHTLRRWDVEEGAEVALPNEPVYEIKVNCTGAGLQVKVAPVHTTLAEIEGMPQISMLVQVNSGVPCVHIHGAEGDGLAMRLWGLPDGVIGITDGDHHVETRAMGQVTPDAKEIADRISTLAARNARATVPATASSEAPRG